MMDFARRLAPVRDTELTRAVAAMPSRFEGEGRVPEPLAPANPVVAIEPVAQAMAQPRAAFAGTEAASSSRSKAGPVREPSDAPRTPPATMSFHAAQAVPESVAHNERPLGSSQQPAWVPRGMGAEAILPKQVQEPPQPALSHTALPASVAGQPHPAEPVRVAAVAATDAASPSSPLRITPHRPLSEAALASRASTAPAPRPVVRVSIDRIEVRAPAAKPAPAPASRARAAAPSVSLADYLRHGNPARGGRP